MAYPEKRGKTWRVRWQLPEVDENGRHKEGSESGFATRRAALDYGEDQEAAIRAGTWIDPKRGQLTLAEWWERWIKAQDLAERSRDHYETTWRNHVGPAFGAKPLGAITGLDVDAWYTELLTRRSLRTAKGARQLLKMLCDDATADRLIQASPVRPATRRRGRVAAAAAKPQRIGIVVDLETVQQLRHRMIAADYLMVLVAAFTGMRWGELIGMRRQFLHLTPAIDDDEEASGYYIIDALVGAVHEDKRGRRTYGPPKGYKGRTVELPPFLVELLLAHLKRMPRTGPAAHDPAKTTQPDPNLLFPNRAGAPWARNNWHPIWRRACDGYPARDGRQGQSALLEAPPICEGLVMHDLRHTHKTWLAEDGIQPGARDERLGHSPNDREKDRGGMDEVYVHVTPKMRARLLEVLERRWEMGQTGPE